MWKNQKFYQQVFFAKIPAKSCQNRLIPIFNTPYYYYYLHPYPHPYMHKQSPPQNLGKISDFKNTAKYRVLAKRKESGI